MPPVLVCILFASWLQSQGEIFACPMHPEIQSATSGVCHRCGMALTMQSADPEAREYVMGIEPVWDPAGKSALLRFRFQTADGREAGAFQTVHERELHVFVVDRNLQFFEHVHPARDGSGEFSLRMAFPRLGEYMFFADFAPLGAAPQLLQQLLITPTFRGRMDIPALWPASGDQVSQGVRFSLTLEEFRAASPALLTFFVTDAETGAPIRDLEPYLGAAGHLFLVNAGLEDGSHSHPLEASPGPSVRFLTRFNTAGIYRIWLQVKRRGQVITVGWTLDVPEPR